MCLAYITERIPSPTSLIQSGWKTFSGTPEKPLFGVSAFKGKMTVPLDKWITAESNPISGNGVNYLSGFHVYENETELKKWDLNRRVYFRGVHTVGTQGGVTVVIAREMYVPSDPEAWPPL